MIVFNSAFLPFFWKLGAFQQVQIALSELHAGKKCATTLAERTERPKQAKLMSDHIFPDLLFRPITFVAYFFLSY